MISKELFELIYRLSMKDKKNLAQKALKTAEETGELAKAVLPFVNAPGNTHKFSDQKKITEEVADVILSALSVGINANATIDDIMEMLWHKAEYWAELQNRENYDSDHKYPYELHVTVSPETNQNLFKQVCQKLNVKPIVLDLEDDARVLKKDIMTSSKFFGTNEDAYNEIKKISQELKNQNITILREKIETVPWHPAAPRKNGNQKMSKYGYFEAHFDIKISNTDLDKLFNISRIHNLYISKNLKKQTELTSVVMATYRSYKGYFEDFESKIGIIYSELIKDNFDCEKALIEYSLYDTLVTHDKEWIKN
jgi:NTP pyrophosphatase (non-canonical NTP hydrolase)